MTSFVLEFWHLLLSILVGMENEEQQRDIEYLRIENQVLKDKMGRSEFCSSTISDAVWP